MQVQLLSAGTGKTKVHIVITISIAFRFKSEIQADSFIFNLGFTEIVCFSGWSG